MATVTPTRYPDPDSRMIRVGWVGFAASADVGTEVKMPAHRDRSVQVIGTFTGSLGITIEGSNDGGTTWTALTDPQGNSIVKTAAALEAITEFVGLIRPRATAGSGGAAVDVYICFGGNYL